MVEKAIGVIISLQGNLAEHLKSATVLTISNDECAISYNDLIIIDEGLICTSTKTGKGTTWGDNGSPLVAHGGVIGIALADFNNIRYPSTYTRISNYYDWIVSVAGW